MVNKAKDDSIKDGRSFLKDRFIDVEKFFVQQLRLNQKRITHDGALGDATEDVWIQLLQDYLPTRYRVAKAFAVDYLGNTTQQLDCLIYDAHFTPALFGKDNHLYVPAEAVYATFEIKQTINVQHLKNAGDKVASLRALHRTSAPLENATGVSEPKQLFPIMGGLLGMKASWKDGLGNTFLKQFNTLSGDRKLDLVLTASNGFCDHLVTTYTPTIVHGPGSLIRGLFRLLKALRAKATVAAVDWEKYESVFDA
ncbi:MAG: hypothetical protein Q8P75_00440 [bacterium]|nr:hypothetical protein [bacterium]